MDASSLDLKRAKERAGAVGWRTMGVAAVALQAVRCGRMTAASVQRTADCLGAWLLQQGKEATRRMAVKSE